MIEINCSFYVTIPDAELAYKECLATLVELYSPTEVTNIQRYNNNLRLRLLLNIPDGELPRIQRCLPEAIDRNYPDAKVLSIKEMKAR